MSDFKFPLVTFIIPFFNGHVTIKETLLSIKSQNYPNYEVIIVNDGSTASESKEILKELKDDKIQIHHQENKGPSSARNLAINLAKGKYIVPLDSDDLIEPNTLQETVRFLEHNLSFGVAYGNVRMLPSNQIRPQEEVSLATMLVYNQLVVSAIIRKDLFIELAGYDAQLDKLGLEDWEFWLRVLQSKWKVKKMESIHFSIRENEESRTHLSANQNLDEIKQYVYQKHAIWISEQFEQLYYQHKMLEDSIHVKVGNVIFQPYRFIKKLLKS